MNYLIVLQLMAWHSSAGFTFMVTENMVKPQTPVRRRIACIRYYNKLSRDMVELRACKSVPHGPYWQCSSHGRSELGHDASIQRLKHRKKAINWKINRLGREIERTMLKLPC